LDRTIGQGLLVPSGAPQIQVHRSIVMTRQVGSSLIVVGIQ
jgi:hydroquinone glucosyltransferase